MSTFKVNNGIIEVLEGSITHYEADALICPANPDLQPIFLGPNVQVAFLRDGGQEIFDELLEQAKLYGTTKGEGLPYTVPPTSAHITNAGRLRAKYVIHSVAVDYDPKIDDIFCDRDVVYKSAKNVLDLAAQYQLVTLGFPLLGTGLFGVPVKDSLDGIMTAVSEYFSDKTSLIRVGILLYSPSDYSSGLKLMRDRFKEIPDIALNEGNTLLGYVFPQFSKVGGTTMKKEEEILIK